MNYQSLDKTILYVGYVLPISKFLHHIFSLASIPVHNYKSLFNINYTRIHNISPQYNY